MDGEPARLVVKTRCGLDGRIMTTHDLEVGVRLPDGEVVPISCTRVKIEADAAHPEIIKAHLSCYVTEIDIECDVATAELESYTDHECRFTIEGPIIKEKTDEP